MKRYGFYLGEWGGEIEDGDYVKYEDVEKLIEWMKGRVYSWEEEAALFFDSSPKAYCAEELEQKIRELES